VRGGRHLAADLGETGLVLIAAGELLVALRQRGLGGRQGGGSKAPKIKPQALLGLKNGRGF
jgi:hypothetical protein